MNSIQIFFIPFILFFPTIMLSQQNGENMILKKIIFDSKKNIFFEENNRVYENNGNYENSFRFSVSSINSTATPPKEPWANFELYGDTLLSLHYRHFCFWCDSMSLSSVPFKLFFECRDARSFPKPIDELVVYVPSDERLNLPARPKINYLDSLFYDFLNHQNKLYLLLLTEGQLHMYQAADSQNICANSWVFKNTFELGIQPAYFVSYVENNSERIKLLFDEQGEITIDWENNTIERRQYSDPLDHFLIIDQSDGTAYRVNDETAKSLLEAKKPYRFFTKKIKR